MEQNSVTYHRLSFSLSGLFSLNGLTGLFVSSDNSPSSLSTLSLSPHLLCLCIVRVTERRMTLWTTPCILGKVLLRTTRRMRSPVLSLEWGEAGLGDSGLEIERQWVGDAISSGGRMSENVLGGGLLEAFTSIERFRALSLPGFPHTKSFLPPRLVGLHSDKA